MLSYVAVALNSGGGVVRHDETNEVKNVLLGEFESREPAIDTACELFKCHHVLKGVIIRGNHTGGHMIMDTQEFSSL
ncbi:MULTISPECIES: hypothetical protein [Vibrio]|uniref:Uncharacterized protein n=1 Tax=Vibrio lentus TaxID=136468 RepID=A0A2N7BLI0_9VIBR|nr:MULTISPECIES: hypothetical protein [Vibrio]MCC4783113.1 hypothetical protein [Vibrio lentus]PME50886.1 hypothetical protein BCV34_01235 [Vibrio lentus]PME58922.1 hypothetical protein BCV30_15530 [Vibrio lentus]PME80865.1 hypothetical protein BCV27_15100 [Vibrio lentus]PMH66902.1 hypothetical protein BCU61_03985 [Vibrio splendidus]